MHLLPKLTETEKRHKVSIFSSIPSEEMPMSRHKYPRSPNNLGPPNHYSPPPKSTPPCKDSIYRSWWLSLLCLYGWSMGDVYSPEINTNNLPLCLSASFLVWHTLQRFKVLKCRGRICAGRRNTVRFSSLMGLHLSDVRHVRRYISLQCLHRKGCRAEQREGLVGSPRQALRHLFG
jgi:hypothetical protein